MTNEALKQLLSEKLPEATWEEGAEWPILYPVQDSFLQVMQMLKEDPALRFDYLFCLTCIDWSATATGKTLMTMVYHLSSTTYRHNLVVKLKLDRTKPEVETVSSIWPTAEFHEREVYEMFGVNFLHHPDLRLLILPDGWEGKNPMRKDYEDPVNMIRL